VAGIVGAGVDLREARVGSLVLDDELADLFELGYLDLLVDLVDAVDLALLVQLPLAGQFRVTAGVRGRLLATGLLG